MIDLRCDAHVHTAFASGQDSVSVLVDAAERAELTGLTFADRVGPDSTWLPSYLAAIHRARQRTDVTLRCGAEVEAIGADGWVDFPTDLGGLEVISVDLRRLPLPAGLAGPAAIRTLVAAGGITAAEVVEQYLTVACRALERVSRYAPTTLARPMAMLVDAGIAESAVDEDALAFLASACRACGATVEMSEWYQVPSARVAQSLAAAGVPLVAASDARQGTEVGAWHYVRTTATRLAAVTTGSPTGRRHGGAQPLS